MKLHNPFDSAAFLPGFCAIISIVLLLSLAIAFYSPLLLGVLLLPIIYTIRYMLKGE